MKGLIKIGWILLLLLAGWQVGVAQDDTANDDFADPWDPWEEGEYDIPAPIVHSASICQGDAMNLDFVRINPREGETEESYELIWFDSEVSDVEQNISIINTDIAGIYAFYVAQKHKESGILSDRVKFELNVIEKPRIEVLSPVRVCEQEVDLASVGKIENSVDIFEMQYLDGKGNTISNVVDASGTYWIRCIDYNACYSDDVEVEVIIDSLNSPEIHGPMSVCPYEGFELIAYAESNVSEIDYHWDGSFSGLGNLLYIGASGISGEIYEVRVQAIAGTCSKYSQDPMTVFVEGGIVDGSMTIETQNETIVLDNDNEERVVQVSDDQVTLSVNYEKDNVEYEWYDYNTNAIIGNGETLTINSEGLSERSLFVKYVNRCPIELDVKIYFNVSKSEKNWTDIVTSRPDSYVETTGSDGKTTITLKDEKALAWLASVAAGYNGATQSSFENTEVVLDANVDMSAHVWSGIKEFYGSLHGQGNSIIGLRINDDTPNGFSLIDTLRKEGEIKDLRLEDVSIDVNAEVGVASFVSWNFGVLKNCSSDGFVQAYYPAGGLVGHNSGEILSCKNSATVAAVGSVGGIANYNYNLIADCVNEGTLSSGNGCGGICNLLGNGEIRNSINKGSVSGKSTSGGVVALCTGSETAILNSCNVANVTVPSGISSFALSGFEGNGVDCSILNCYSSISQPLYSTDDNYDGNVKAQYIYFPSSNTTDKESNEDYIASFSPAEGSDGNDWTLSYEVFGTTDLVEALNAWVAEQDDDIYSSWAVDEDMENGGYPILTFKPWEELPEVEQKNSLWTDIVTSRPDSYVETTDADGKTIITLKDEEALAWLASVAGGYNGATQSSFENTEVVLSASVNMSAYVWSCIPNFNGYFNGNKKSVTGLRIANNTPNGFAFIKNLQSSGEIRNLNFKKSDLNLIEVKSKTAIALVVENNYGLIQNCSNSGNLYASTSYLSVRLAGIVAVNYGTVLNCSNEGTVVLDYSECTPTYVDYQATAGIVAWLKDNSVISDCMNLATITGCSCTGGIVGAGGGEIRNCGNRGNVSGGGSYCAGIIASMGKLGKIINSYNVGTIQGNEGVASLVGYRTSGSKIFNCYSASSIPLYHMREGDAEMKYVYWNADSINSTQYPEWNLVSFKEAEYSQGYDWTLSSEVLGTTDLLTALNNWVIQQDTSIYSGWKAANVQINKGYPILEFGYDPFNQYDTLTVDTLLNLCTKTQYGGKQYTINDEGTVQPVVIGNKYYTNPTLHIKDPDFSKVKVHRPSLICASDTIKLYAEGAESYCWRYGVDTLSVSDGVELVLNEDRRIQLVTEIDGCYRTFNTDVKLNQDSVLIEMGGWGDVIAIKNPNSLFSSYQWYRDGELLEDEMGQFYYEPQGLTPGLYSVDIIDTSGNLVPICPLLIVREDAKSSSQSISLYPNPVRAMQPFYVEVMAPDFDKAVMTVSDESGVELLRREPVAKLNELRLPSGYYVVTVYLSDKKIVSDKILIE
ncbi:MAG: hypothetical protein IKL19_04395 [Paludibacteraceae bacterium]|nr:hypothetical protein [Paludibacteraceae bacterium]